MELTIRETAAVLGISRQRVHQLIAAGRIDAIRRGPALRVTDFSRARVRINGRHLNGTAPEPPANPPAGIAEEIA